MIIEHSELKIVTATHLKVCSKILKNCGEVKPKHVVDACFEISCMMECPFWDDNIKTSKRCDDRNFDILNSARLLIVQGLKEE